MSIEILKELCDGKLKTNGNFLKVHLPGESPWVEFIKMTGEKSFVGKINNHLVNTEIHGIIFDDEVEFELKYYDDFKVFEPTHKIKGAGE